MMKCVLSFYLLCLFPLSGLGDDLKATLLLSPQERQEFENIGVKDFDINEANEVLIQANQLSSGFLEKKNEYEKKHNASYWGNAPQGKSRAEYVELENLREEKVYQIKLLLLLLKEKYKVSKNQLPVHQAVVSTVETFLNRIEPPTSHPVSQAPLSRNERSKTDQDDIESDFKEIFNALSSKNATAEQKKRANELYLQYLKVKNTVELSPQVQSPAQVSTQIKKGYVGGSAPVIATNQTKKVKARKPR